MSFFDGVKDYFNKKSEDRLEMEAVQRQLDIERRREFMLNFKRNSLEVVRAKAQQDAMEKSGLNKLRAMNNAARLGEAGPAPGTFFEKMRDYTQKNLANREQNLARTKIMQQGAEEQKMISKVKREAQRMNSPMVKPRTIGFNKSQWKQ